MKIRVQQFEHVKAYYARIETRPGKFEGEPFAVQVAYDSWMDGFYHDDFEFNGESYARVCFDDCPNLVCFYQNETGFVREITNS